MNMEMLSRTVTFPELTAGKSIYKYTDYDHKDVSDSITHSN